MCPFPNEAIDRTRRVLTRGNYTSQLVAALDRSSTPDLLCIYNDGSFFAERELPSRARAELLRIASHSGAAYLMVESLPQFITRAKLQSARTILEGIRLVVGIGFQSSSRIVRELCINSPVTEASFLSAREMLRALGCSVKAYVMLKPPFLTEREAIADAVSSCCWLANAGVDDITVCPTRVAPNTTLSALHARGQYSPPRLSSLAKVIIGTASLEGPVRVSLFNVSSSSRPAAMPVGCDGCNAATLEALEAHNRAPGSVNFWDVLCADCQREVPLNSAELEMGQLPISKRVERFLQSAPYPAPVQHDHSGLASRH